MPSEHGCPLPTEGLDAEVTGVQSPSFVYLAMSLGISLLPGGQHPNLTTGFMSYLYSISFMIALMFLFESTCLFKFSFSVTADIQYFTLISGV